MPLNRPHEIENVGPGLGTSTATQFNSRLSAPMSVRLLATQTPQKSLVPDPVPSPYRLSLTWILLNDRVTKTLSAVVGPVTLGFAVWLSTGRPSVLLTASDGSVSAGS